MKFCQTLINMFYPKPLLLEKIIFSDKPTYKLSVVNKNANMGPKKVLDG